MTEEQQLKQKYIIEKKSTWQIAVEMKVSQTTIRRWMLEYQIPRRTHSETAKMTLNGFKENENHPMWQETPSYQALHSWVARKKGRPMKCEHCGRTDKKKYEWANISHEYKRDLEDWVRLCTKCHRAYDRI